MLLHHIQRRVTHLYYNKFSIHCVKNNQTYIHKQSRQSVVKKNFSTRKSFLCDHPMVRIFHGTLNTFYSLSLPSFFHWSTIVHSKKGVSPSSSIFQILIHLLLIVKNEEHRWTDSVFLRPKMFKKRSFEGQPLKFCIVHFVRII